MAVSCQIPPNALRQTTTLETRIHLTCWKKNGHARGDLALRVDSRPNKRARQAERRHSGLKNRGEGRLRKTHETHTRVLQVWASCSTCAATTVRSDGEKSPPKSKPDVMAPDPSGFQPPRPAPEGNPTRAPPVHPNAHQTATLDIIVETRVRLRCPIHEGCGNNPGQRRSSHR